MWLFLILVIGGLFLLIGNLSKFTPSDAPEFKPRALKAYVGFLSMFIFAIMWIIEKLQVISTGDTTTGSYSAVPTRFWMFRFLDLEISIPVGYLAILLMLSEPKKAYPVVLLFFGFFITMGTAVNAMALVEVFEQRPIDRRSERRWTRHIPDLRNTGICQPAVTIEGQYHDVYEPPWCSED